MDRLISQEPNQKGRLPSLFYFLGVRLFFLSDQATDDGHLGLCLPGSFYAASPPELNYAPGF